MTLFKYILIYLFLLVLCTIVLFISWLIGIKNLLFLFFIEASLLFIADSSIRTKYSHQIEKIFINKFGFSKEKFDYFMKATKTEHILGYLFIILANISLICYPNGYKSLLILQNILSIITVSLGISMIIIINRKKIFKFNILNKSFKLLSIIIILIGFLVTLY